MYVQLHVLNEARDLVFGLWLHRCLFFVYGSSKGSSEAAQTLACLSHDCLLMQYVPKSHTLAHIWALFK